MESRGVAGELATEGDPPTYQRSVNPKRMLRPGKPTALMIPPVVRDGTPKPVASSVRPALSMKGSIELKFGWLNAFSMVMCQTTLKFSLTFTVFEREKLPIFDQASRKVFRPTVPNGVGNRVEDWLVVAIKRTSLLVTTVAAPVALIAFKLRSEFANNGSQNGSLPVAPKLLQASAPNMPTELTGAEEFPRNGRRAPSAPTKALLNGPS